MSKGNRGQGHNQPAPSADSARVAPAAPREAAPVVAAPTVDTSGTAPRFVEPFEPPLPIPPPDHSPQAAEAAAEKVVREELGAVSVDPNASPGVVEASIESKLDALAASLGSISELERDEDAANRDKDRKPECTKCTNERPCSVECFVAAGYQAEHYEARFGKHGTGIPGIGLDLPADGVERTVELEALHVDPQRNGKPLPAGAVMVRALRGVVVRVQHRAPGDRFWLLQSRPDDDANLLSEYADEFVDRGDVELL